VRFFSQPVFVSFCHLSCAKVSYFVSFLSLRPWHIFVDTSPDADADFEVAATFDDEPSTEDVNFAIVECLEGSEREDELVAQQMQEALEAGQLNKVSQMLEISMGGVEGDGDEGDPEDDEANEDDDFFFGCDST
jgi:hypothetical protein